MVVKKENNFYEEMKKIDISGRQTLAGQFLKEYEMSQAGISSKTDFSQTAGADIRTSAVELLENAIKEKTEKIARMNKQLEHIHFRDDQEIVEMYEVVHSEEQALKKLTAKLEIIKKEKEGYQEL